MMRRQRPQIPGGDPTPAPEPSPPVNSSSEEQSQEPVLRHNGLALDSRTRSAAVGGTVLELTRSEFDVLQELIRVAGAVLSKKDLARALRGEYYREDPSTIDSDERAVEVHIGNLRRKLRDDPEKPRWLQTVRGVGYRLVTDD